MYNVLHSLPGGITIFVGGHGPKYYEISDFYGNLRIYHRPLKINILRGLWHLCKFSVSRTVITVTSSSLRFVV